MRLMVLITSLLLALIQYPLWFGKGGWLHVWELERELVKQERENGLLQLRNVRLAAEVNDLREGTGATEELARFEFGLIRQSERFIQLVPSASSAQQQSSQ